MPARRARVRAWRSCCWSRSPLSAPRDRRPRGRSRSACHSTSAISGDPRSGFPGGPVHAITQTTDGYLWIAAEKGLVRFDGLTFRSVVAPPGRRRAPGRRCSASPPDADGGLWARLRGPALVRYRNGAFEQVSVTGRTKERW